MHHPRQRWLLLVPVLLAAIAAVLVTAAWNSGATPGRAGWAAATESPNSSDPAAAPATTTSAPPVRAATSSTRNSGSPIPTRPVSTEPPADVATDPPVPTSSHGQVGVVVTDAGWNTASSSVEATAFVTGAIETDGTCTLTLTSGARQVTAQVDAVPDASTTSCGLIAIEGQRLQSGTWQAVVSYRSPRSTGTSAATAVTVP